MQMRVATRQDNDSFQNGIHGEIRQRCSAVHATYAADSADPAHNNIQAKRREES